MKAAIFYGGPDIRVEDRPMPEPAEGEVLVRVHAAGICGSDLHGYRRASPWERPGESASGREGGHELAGEVAALGPGVEGLEGGQRVGIEPEHLLGCGRCEWCRRGDSHLCPQRGMRHGERHSSHGFSQYDVCVASNVHPLPDEVSLEAAAILDCYACAVHAANRVRITPSTTVVVIGTGAVGMALGQVARTCGAARVVMVGTREGPLSVAMETGAADSVVATSAADISAEIRAATDGRSADVVFESVGGEGQTLDQAILTARPGGTVTVLGVFTKRVELDTAAVFEKELTIRWSNSYSTWEGVSEYRIALELMTAGRLQAEPLITHRYGLGEVREAFAAAADKRSSGAIKVIVHP